MNVRLVIKRVSGETFEETKLLSFTFKKDSYIPYTSFNAKIYSETNDYSSIAEIMFYIGEKLVHHGLIDSVTRTKCGDYSSVLLSSKGFTSLLCRNQLQPGMITGISINSLMDNYYTLPYVTHEDNSDSSNYIYVKSGSSMWDGIVNLSYKLCGTYPYIRDTNCVRITHEQSPSIYSYESNAICSSGIAYNFNRMISDFHMADINGEYGTYDLTDNNVAEKKIIRHSCFELDRQFLYNPSSALDFRDKYVNRKGFLSFCRYNGYNGEDLFDIVSFENVHQKKITSIEITGSSKGIFTELSICCDKFLPNN